MLNKGQVVGNFCVEEFIKASADHRSESYWVRYLNNGQKSLMRLRAINDEESRAVDREAIRALSVPTPFFPELEGGSVMLGGEEHLYSVRRYVDGVPLHELIDRSAYHRWEDAQPVILEVLKALKYLHDREHPILHNDITPRNILVGEQPFESRVYVIGLGHLSHCTNGRTPFCTKDLNNWYRAPETFKGIYSERSDIFSVGVLLYKMLTCREPWSSMDEEDPAADKNRLKLLRACGMRFVDRLPLTDGQKEILRKMLALDYSERYQTVDRVIEALQNGSAGECGRKVSSVRPKCEEKGPAPSEPEMQFDEFTQIEPIDAEAIKPRVGGGFAEVAGMAEVKQMLYREVMFVMQNKEKAAKYRLKMPNGALFYGPPGCGKTFIAEKFAEESHLNFMIVKASDLASIYIHGTQGRISELFEAAARKAPTVLCFDELDGMVPDRSKVHNEGASGEVNEFLSQLNNCSDRGIFVIGTSNRPEKIDPAILRTGRIDKMVYIPLPDLEARKELFRLHLDGRFCDESIDVGELARRSEGYVASDIRFMVDESALEAAVADVPISQQLILDGIGKARRSVTQADAADYERMRRKFEEQAPCGERRRIGY